jgi:Amt family ammonium transporter
MATAAALLTWVLWDMYLGKAKKPTFLGAVNGLVVGLVAITPSAGYVNGLGALLIGVIDSTIVWMAWTYLSRARIMKKVDDAMGIVYTHGIAGLFGGLLLGVFADPSVVVYQHVPVLGQIALSGAIYGHHYGQIGLQAGAALTVIIWDAGVTFIILKVISLFTPLRMPDADLEIGDLAVHDEEAYPDEGGTRVSSGYGEDSPASPVPYGVTAGAVVGGGA